MRRVRLEHFLRLEPKAARRVATALSNNRTWRQPQRWHSTRMREFVAQTWGVPSADALV